ncbi:MAG: M28 family peptidase [Planctomycetota bacterium]
MLNQLLLASSLLAGTSDPSLLAAARASITASRLIERAQVLAADTMEGRNAGSPGNDRAAAYLSDCLAELCLEPRGQDGGYLDWFSFPLRARGETAHTQNVVALWRGSDLHLRDEVVVLGAHFDHVGQQGEPDAGRAPGGDAQDTIWNGADDNASGSTVLLGIAEALARSQLHLGAASSSCGSAPRSTASMAPGTTSRRRRDRSPRPA